MRHLSPVLHPHDASLPFSLYLLPDLLPLLRLFLDHFSFLPLFLILLSSIPSDSTPITLPNYGVRSKSSSSNYSLKLILFGLK